MKVEIEDIPIKNRGVDITSENEDEKAFLEDLWTRSAAAVAFRRHNNGSVTISVAPTREDKD